MLLGLFELLFVWLAVFTAAKILFELIAEVHEQFLRYLKSLDGVEHINQSHS